MPHDLSAELGALISRARLADDDQLDIEPMVVPYDADPLAFIWNSGQRQGLTDIVRWRMDKAAPRFMKVTGPAGTGKSTFMKGLRDMLRGTRTAWSAMTGKAATRLREASGVPGKTFHSVVFQPPREVDNVAEQRIDLEFESVRPNGRSCLLVVDEASMIGPKLRADAERSPYEKILWVGDPYQIPPVLSRQEEEERGADYSVFAGVPGPHLTEVMRARGAVLTAATYVRERQAVPEESVTDGGSAYVYREAANDDQALGLAIQSWLDDQDDHVLITWRNDVRVICNRVIRAALGLKGDLPLPGEPLVVRKNVYGADLMNGDIITVEEWSDTGPTLAGLETRWLDGRKVNGDWARFLAPSKNFSGTLPYVPLDVWKKALDAAGVDDVIPVTFAYCLTGHLVQGSEYRRATTLLVNDFSNPHFRKMTRLPDGGEMRFSMRFLYTALARAKAHTSLIVSR